MRHDPKRTGGKHLKIERYSKTAFDAHGLDSDEAKRLADQLAHDVCIELTRAASNRLAEIIGELNAAGHRLVRYEAGPGDVAYRDGYHATPAALRIAFRLDAEAGYPHLVDEQGAAIPAVSNWGGGGSPGANRED